jgi:hypothetical protein
MTWHDEVIVAKNVFDITVESISVGIADAKASIAAQSER